LIPPVLNTRRFVIQPYRTQDEERFVEMGIDSEVARFMDGADDDPEKQHTIFNKIFNHYNEPETNPPTLFWGIFENDVLCGHVQLKPTDHSVEGELEIVYMVHPKERNRGLMWEVLEIFKQEQNRGQSTIIATVDLDNETSIRLLEKWGVTNKETRIDSKGEYWKVNLSK
jgi:RimJ/RimL family protein N-acetyltransferase